MDKVWVTKYALTRGVYEQEGEFTRDFCFRYNGHYLLHEHEWHPTQKEALKIAEQMRLDKIKNLKKQLQKLEQMKF